MMQELTLDDAMRKLEAMYLDGARDGHILMQVVDPPISPRRFQERSSPRRARSPQATNPYPWKLSYKVPKDVYGVFRAEADLSPITDRGRSPRGHSPKRMKSPEEVPVYRYNPRDLTMTIAPRRRDLSPPRPVDLPPSTRSSLQRESTASQAHQQQVVVSRGPLTSPVPREALIVDRAPVVWSRPAEMIDQNRAVSPPRPSAAMVHAPPEMHAPPHLSPRHPDAPSTSRQRTPTQRATPTARRTRSRTPVQSSTPICPCCGQHYQRSKKYEHVKSTIQRLPTMTTDPTQSPRRHKISHPFFVSSHEPGQIHMSPPNERAKGKKGIAWVV